MFYGNIVKHRWSLPRIVCKYLQMIVRPRHTWTFDGPWRSLLLHVLHLNFGHLSNNLHRRHQKQIALTLCREQQSTNVDSPAAYWTTPMTPSADLSNHLTYLNSFNKIDCAQDASRTSTRGTWQPNGQEVFGWGRRLLGTCDRVKIYLL